MKKIILSVSVLLLSSSLFAQVSKEDQIKAALLAAPENTREGAHIYGFDKDGKMITLREGTNNFIVRADDPTKDGFEVVSYPKDLEPYMARGRELKAAGKNFGERHQIREEEMKSGKLTVPNYGSTLQIYYGNEARYNKETETLEGGQFRYVIYTPLATSKTTGLPEKPNAQGHPWVMFPGLYRAHIMITPPSDK